MRVTPPKADVVHGARNVAADRVKVFLVGAVIVTHCALVYGVDGSWFYHEVPPGGPVQVLGLPIAYGELFAMGMFFFLAGSFLPDALARNGSRRFIADRVVRLGVPILLYLFLIAPATAWLVARVVGRQESAIDAWSAQLRELDLGPMWFAAVLLFFSIVAAVVVDRSGLQPRRLTRSRLARFGAVIAIVSFAIRVRFAIDSFQIGAAHLWQWGQCLGLFALGVRSGRAGLDPVDRRTRRACRGVMVACLLVLVVLLAASHGDLDPLGGGWHWQSGVVALLEAAASVTAPVVLLDLFGPRRRTDAERARRYAGAAYVAYVVQVPVLVVLALAVRSVEVPPSLKFLVVGGASLSICFGLGLLGRQVRARRTTNVAHHVSGAGGGGPGGATAPFDLGSVDAAAGAGRDRPTALRLQPPS